MLCSNNGRVPLIVAALAGLFGLAQPPAFAQRSGSSSSTGTANGMDRAMTLFVSVRERSGIPLSGMAVVSVSPLVGGQTLYGSTADAATAAFANIHGGDYQIQVEAAGYETTTERTSVMGTSTCTVYVYVSPLGSGAATSKPLPGTVMTPDMQRELDKSLSALKQLKFDEARKHLEKAHRMAPSNPDVLYLLGVINYTAKDIPAARKQFESVLTAYPTHQRSLIMLGRIQIDANEYKDASVTLQKAVEAGNVSWQAHNLLAIAYLRTGDFSKAIVEADRTAELNKDKLPFTKLLKAKILLMEGRNRDAQLAFEEFLRQYPLDTAAADAKRYLTRIEEANRVAAPAHVPASTALGMPASSEPASLKVENDARAAESFERPWAPPGVDGGIPPVAPDAVCSIPDVLHRTQSRVLLQVADLEKFGATEHIEHQLIDAYGVPGAPASRDFDYIIFVHHTPQLPYYFDEFRNDGEAGHSFPSSIATRGLVSLGFMIIHPVFSEDFEFTCEGLGTWNGKAAWQVHFAQRTGVPSRIRSWSHKNVTYQIPLKGRIWIGANSYNILHLETALRETVPGLRLNREQLSVDYGPVSFLEGQISLWLPEHAEMYFEVLGRRYHHRHTLTNYVLFDVDTKNKINAPSPPREQEDK